MCQLETQWTKVLDAGSGAGGDWALRVSARKSEQDDSIDDVESRPVSVFFYVFLEGSPECGYKSSKDDNNGEESSPLFWNQLKSLLFGFGGKGSKAPRVKEAKLQIDNDAIDGGIVRGSSPHIGHWTLFASNGLGGVLTDLRFAGIHAVSAHNLTDELRPHLTGTRGGRRGPGMPKLLNTAVEGSNVAVFQVTSALPFTLDLSFIGGAGGDEILYSDDKMQSHSTGVSDEASRVLGLRGPKLTALFTKREKAFDSRFEQIFGRDIQSFDLNGNVSSVEIAKAALSNSLGSIGYFYGCSIVKNEDSSGRPKLSLYGPSPLLSGVPSRSFFPRGFLWDEGFHQLLMGRWDRELSRYILAHWLDLMSSSGWIPREQILGKESRARVPDAFVAQDTHAANPPSILLSLEQMLASDPHDETTMSFMKMAWPRLRQFYNWYNTTQIGETTTVYRWRGRDANAIEVNPKTLTSGLDDYPRASHPSPEEKHLDLRCWMVIASRAMSRIGEAIGASEDELSRYKHTYATLSNFNNLNKHHYHKSSKRYLDYGLHAADVSLRQAFDQQHNKVRVVRHVSDSPKLKKVPHFGYVSLFPLIALLLPPSSEELIYTVRQLRDPDLMWSKYGLRSLSKDSSLYQQHNTFDDAPYWRGAVWININYLALSALHKYAGLDERYTVSSSRPNETVLTGNYTMEIRQVYYDLRQNVLQCIFTQYDRTGYLWESYDDSDGNGKGTHPFTGWTALVTLIMGEQYNK